MAYPRRGKPCTFQSSVNSALFAASIARPLGKSAMPTSADPLNTCSAWPSGEMRTIPRRPAKDAAIYKFSSRSTPTLAAGLVPGRTHALHRLA